MAQIAASPPPSTAQTARHLHGPTCHRSSRRPGCPIRRPCRRRLTFLLMPSVTMRVPSGLTEGLGGRLASGGIPEFEIAIKGRGWAGVQMGSPAAIQTHRMAGGHQRFSPQLPRPDPGSGSDPWRLARGARLRPGQEGGPSWDSRIPSPAPGRLQRPAFLVRLAMTMQGQPFRQTVAA